MAKLGINTGFFPNDGLGDNLLGGAIKINSNFNELYNQFGDGINLTFNSGFSISGIITCKDLNCTSDINLKENIEKITNPIEKILQINGYTFNWIEDKTPSIGVIAQDLEKVLPELVSENNNHKVINYNGIIALLIEAIKTQQQEIDKLKQNFQ